MNKLQNLFFFKNSWRQANVSKNACISGPSKRNYLLTAEQNVKNSNFVGVLKTASLCNLTCKRREKLRSRGRHWSDAAATNKNVLVAVWLEFHQQL